MVVLAGSLMIGGAALWPEYILDFALAYLLGILSQYFAIKPRGGWRPCSLSSSPTRAQPDHAPSWFMMQIAMALGLLTTYPVNIWLVRRGIKHRTGRPVLPRPEPPARAGQPAGPGTNRC